MILVMLALIVVGALIGAAGMRRLGSVVRHRPFRRSGIGGPRGGL
jgi:hypothetical protein